MDDDNREYQRVFVFGAGFSKAFSNDMLMVPELTDYLFNDLLTSADNKYSELIEFIKKFSDLKIKDEQKTIENITTLIFSKNIFFDFYDKEKYERLKWQLLYFIYDKLNKYKVDENSKDILIEFLKHCFIETSKHNPRFGKNLFITFNYDLLLENFVEENQYLDKVGNYHIEYPIRLNKYSTFHRDSNSSYPAPVQLLKLHGSFNWFRAKGAADYDINSIYQVDKEDINYFIHENDIPVFIPMAHAKELFLSGTLYNTLWVKADYYLRNADEIYFFGYGFPETDINNLMYFYQFKDKIKNIIVMYQDDKIAELNRLENIFGKDKVLNMDVKEFILENYQSFCHLKLIK